MSRAASANDFCPAADSAGSIPRPGRINKWLARSLNGRLMVLGGRFSSWLGRNDNDEDGANGFVFAAGQFERGAPGRTGGWSVWLPASSWPAFECQ